MYTLPFPNFLLYLYWILNSPIKSKYFISLCGIWCVFYGDSFTKRKYINKVQTASLSGFEILPMKGIVLKIEKTKVHMCIDLNWVSHCVWGTSRIFYCLTTLWLDRQIILLQYEKVAINFTRARAGLPLLVTEIRLVHSP